MRTLYSCVVTSAIFLFSCDLAASTGAGQPAAAWAPPVYAFCIEMGVPKVTPRPIADQAKLLKDIGFDGAGYPLWFGEELDKNLQILDQAGLKAYMFYIRVNLKDAAKPYDPRVGAALARLQGRPVTITAVVSGLKPADPKGMEPAIKALREVADLAAKSGLRVAIYNHVNDWVEAVPFALEVVKKADRANLGVCFNVCHWLKVEGSRDFRPLIRQNAAKIFCVTICGAQVGAKTWTNGLIQPLDRGDFDNRQLLATLREAGYRGPVGVMCYGVPGDPRDYLSRSLKTWKSWQKP